MSNMRPSDQTGQEAYHESDAAEEFEQRDERSCDARERDAHLGERAGNAGKTIGKQLLSAVSYEDRRNCDSKRRKREARLTIKRRVKEKHGSLVGWLGVLLHCTLDSNRFPPLAGRETNADNSPNQGAKWWANEESSNPQPADVGVTGLCVLKNRGDEPGKCPKQKADAEMSSSRGSAKNFKATDFASAVSESITVCALVYNERVCGKVAQMREPKEAVWSHHESNRSAGCNC